MTTRGHATAGWVCLGTDGRPILATARETEQAARAAAVVIAAGGDHVPARAVVVLVGERGWVPLGSTEISLRQQVAELLDDRLRLTDRLRRIGELAQGGLAPAEPDAR